MQTIVHWLRGTLSDWCHLISYRSLNCWEQHWLSFSLCPCLSCLSCYVSPPALQLFSQSSSLPAPSLPSLLASSFINQPLFQVLKPPNPSTHLLLSLLGFLSSWLLRFLYCLCIVTPAVKNSLPLSACHSPPPFAFNAPPPSPPSVWFCVSDHHSFDPLRLSPQESNCSNKSREVLRCILLAPCRADGKRRSHKVRNIQT